MDTREIIRILMLSDFYFTVPVAERWGMIQRLRLRYNAKAQTGTTASPGTDPEARPPDCWPTA